MIKEATLKDVIKILEFRDELYKLDNTYSNRTTKEKIIDTINTSFKYYLYWKNNKIIGQIITSVEKTNEETIFINNIAVLKTNYGSSVASELMNKVILISKSLKKNRIELIVAESNIRAIKFYEKFHFVYEGKWITNKSLLIYTLYLTEKKENNMDKRTYRQCVRVIIIKDKKILLGQKFINGKFICYEFPGGGVEDNDSLEDTVIKECLEEVGILVHSVKSLNIKYKYELDYPNPERAKLYRGGEDNWFICVFGKQNKSLYNADNDKLPHTWVTIDEAINLIDNGPENSFNPTRLEVLNKLKYSKTNNKDKSLITKW